MNKNANMVTIAERTANAVNRNEAINKKQRQKQKDERMTIEKKKHRRNYIIGELVCKYFPEVCNIEPGYNAENAARFAYVEAFISALANDHNLVQILRERANQMLPVFWGDELSSDGAEKPPEGPNV